MFQEREIGEIGFITSKVGTFLKMTNTFVKHCLKTDNLKTL